MDLSSREKRDPWISPQHQYGLRHGSKELDCVMELEVLSPAPSSLILQLICPIFRSPSQMGDNIEKDVGQHI